MMTLLLILLLALGVGNPAVAQDTDQFFAPTTSTTPAPLWLLLDNSQAMAAPLLEVKARVLLWLATVPDQQSIGLASLDGDGWQLIFPPQPLSVQRQALVASIEAWSANGKIVDSAALIKTLQAFNTHMLDDHKSCLAPWVIHLTAGQLLPADPPTRLPKLPLHLQVISVANAEHAGLWRHVLAVDREHADFQQLWMPTLLNEALAQAQSVFAARQAFSVSPAVREGPIVLQQSRVWLGLFQPGYRRQWLGNLKRVDWDVNNPLTLSIRSLLNAREPLHQGGAAQALQNFTASRSRRVWTFAGAYQVSQRTGWASVPALGSDANLSAPSNELLWTANQNPLHDARLQRLLQVTDPAQAADLIAWTRGVDEWDAVSQTRQTLGGLVHAKPLVIDYGFDAQRYATPPTDPNLRYESVVVTTQAGQLHALDAVTLNELFSFIPQEVLADLPQLQQQASRGLSGDALSPGYPGLDGSWQQWRADVWLTDEKGVSYQDQQINAQQGDHVFIFGGMRRGGYNYYALDVTAAKPQWLSTPSLIAAHLQYVIRGGDFDHVPMNSPYRMMGQTWSEPKLAQVRLRDGVQAVWFFGGGYDVAYDDFANILNEKLTNEKTLQPKKGSALYMINANTGALLWWAAQQNADTEHVDLRHSIVASPKLLDVDNDGLVDRIYWVDLGGQVFRQDIDNRQQSPMPALTERIRLQRLAALGGAQADDRQFFHPPSVAVLADSSGRSRVVIAVASSNPEQPLETQVQNRVAVLLDDLNLNSVVSTRTFADLSLIDFNASSGITLTEQSLGWYWPLGQGRDARGEKVLVSPLIIRNQLLISSVLPFAGGEENLCLAKQQLAMQRFYVLDALSGAASVALRHYTDLGGNGRYRQYASDRTLPAALQLVWAQEKPAGVLVGADVYRFGQQLLLPDQPLAITKGWRRLQRQVLSQP
jgi:Tfp pilus tip-associated adhesin PilY1